MRAIRWTGCPEWVLDQPLTSLNSMAGSIVRLTYQEKYEDAWVAFAAAQAQHKDFKALTDGWQKAMQLDPQAPKKTDKDVTDIFKKLGKRL